ncbi:MAG: flagellar hook basal-body protein [Cyanobacteria bacterium]|nr:flagellar hook basal-body protein [Cyanobacteriota bacterium]MDA1020403.1 flagellar hook basal-body protein [Cyanobacteriota bacterium]
MFNQYTYNSISSVNHHMHDLGNRVVDINNIFTTGYRGKQTSFHETIHGMKMVERRDFNNGAPAKTNRELDFAIQGKGFFEVELPDGTRGYTRNGSFTVGPNGELMSAQGYPLITSHPNNELISQNYDNIAGGQTVSFDAGATSSTIILPIGSNVSLDEEGTLSTVEGTVLGRLSVVNFTNNDALQDVGQGLFIATEEAGDIYEMKIGAMLGQTQVRQGHLEQANVSIVDKMADIVQLNTAIKAEMKIIKVLDQMQENLNSSISRNL